MIKSTLWLLGFVCMWIAILVRAYIIYRSQFGSVVDLLEIVVLWVFSVAALIRFFRDVPKS